MRTLVYKNEHGHFPDDISGDGKWVAMTKLKTTNDRDIYLWNADTKALTHLTPHKGEAQYSPATFDPASRYLYHLSNEGSEFTRLRRYSLAAGTHEDVEKADWDVTFTSFSHNGRDRVTDVKKDGRAGHHGGRDGVRQASDVARDSKRRRGRRFDCAQ